MKYLIFILFILTACQKEEQDICKTCTLTISESATQSNPPNKTWIESQNQYCNGQSDTVKQGIISQIGHSSDGGSTWIWTTKTMECK